jgi:hypothetical protein
MCYWIKPYARAFDAASAPLAFLGALLIICGISDLASVAMPEEIARHYWGAQGQSSYLTFQRTDIGLLKTRINTSSQHQSASYFSLPLHFTHF